MQLHTRLFLPQLTSVVADVKADGVFATMLQNHRNKMP
jgi:hypothetical protein